MSFYLNVLIFSIYLFIISSFSKILPSNRQLSQHDFFMMAINFLNFNLTLYNGRRNWLYHPHLLHKINVDISFGPFLLLSRQQLSPITYGFYDMFVCKPQPQLPSTYFLDVFSPKLWMSVCFIILIIILWLIVYNKLNKHKTSNLVDSIFKTFGVASSAYTIPSLKSLNLLNAVTSIFCFSIAAGQSAFLVAELLTVKYKFPFSDLNDIWNQSEYSVCALRNDFAYFFVSSKNKKADSLLNNEKCHALIGPNHNSSYVNLCNSPQTVYISTSESMSKTDKRCLINYNC